MRDGTLLLLQGVGREGHLRPYVPDAAEWWAWVGAACFLIGVVGFSAMGLRATPKGRGAFATQRYSSCSRP